MQLYKAEGTSGYTLYAETDEAVYCEIHFPSGDAGDVRVLDDDWPMARVKGQLGAEPIEAGEVDGLFAVKAQILDTLESADGSLTTDEVHASISAESVNTTYGALKHLAWDEVVERESAEVWSLGHD